MESTARRVILKNANDEYIVPEVAKATSIEEGNMDPPTSDAVHKALAGLIGKSIGEIFAYPASIPPEGAYLLNGQTIANCRELYPKFWEWLTDNAGDMIATPVYQAWTMPALEADGTLGGSDYAVEASGAVASGYAAYKSFDGTHGGTNSYASIASVTSGSLIWYSPKKLKITRLVFLNPTAGTIANRMVSFEIFGSNDGLAWDSLTSGTVDNTANSATQTVEIPESKFNADIPGYQYLKIEAVNAGGSNLHFPEITIYGEEYLYTDYAGNGTILAMSNEAYEYTLARTGVCGGFVIDTATGNVRIPRVVNGTLWGADSSSIGQSLGAVSSHPAASGINRVDYHLDASNSNPIYGNSNTVQPPAIRVSWCIQVFNAATALSEQESAQLASQMQMKAQTDFGNVAENLDFVVEKWSDGAGGWYRKYRSGWVEQGGAIGQGTTSGYPTYTVSLFKPFANTSFNVQVTGRFDSSTDKGTNTCYARTETSISIVTAGYGCDWYACGQGATE